jgi:hypothetical protein
MKYRKSSNNVAIMFLKIATLSKITKMREILPAASDNKNPSLGSIRQIFAHIKFVNVKANPVFTGQCIEVLHPQSPRHFA